VSEPGEISPDQAEIIRATVARLNLLVITPLGRSGSMLLQTLFDGHPEVACFSEVSQHWQHWTRFQEAGYDISVWLDRNPGFHDGSDFGDTESDNGRQILAWFGGRRTRFEAAFGQVWDLTASDDLPDGRRFIACLALGLAILQGQDVSSLKYIVFQQHNHKAMASDTGQMLSDFPELKMLATCRHPIESALSFHTLVKRTGQASFRNFSRNVRGWSSACWRHLEIAAVQFDASANLRLLDLNSLHGNPDGNLGRLVRWLGIQDHPALHRSTMFGVDWGGNSADGTPIPTFAEKRSVLAYPGTVGLPNGLTLDEYRFAERLTRGICASAGYPDPEIARRTGVTGFLMILFRRMEWFRADVIAHDRGLKKLARRMGVIEVALVLREALSLRRSIRRDFAGLRLDVTDQPS
jgi:hypothetical protein